MKIKKVLLFLLVLAFIPCIFLFTGCNSSKQIEIRIENDYVQWSYEGENTWTNVISVDSIKDSLGVAYQGNAGVDGKQVEFRKTQDYIQWHYVGESSWQNLIAISELKNDDNSSVDENPQGLAFYPLDDGTYGVGIGYATQLSHIEIPGTYKGKTVTTIVEESFIQSSFYSIKLPKTIKTIQCMPYSYNLESIYIDDLSFWLNIDFDRGLDEDVDLYLNGEKLEDVVIPSNIEEIKPYAFRNCRSLKSVKISENVTKIGYMAFSCCENLTEVIISKNVEQLDSCLFDGFNENLTVYFESVEIKSTWSQSWNSMEHSSGYEDFANFYLYSETRPTVEGKFWHYVNDVVTKW